MLRSRTAFAVAVLLVLAGCAGGAGQSPADLTVTPAPVPTDATPTPAHRLAPGLSSAGLIAPLALTSAHDEHLRSTAFHVRIEERTVGPDGGTSARVFEGTFVNRTTYRIRVREVAGNRTVLERSFYANGTALYERHVTPDSVRYYLTNEQLSDRSPYPPDRLGSRTQRDELYVAFIGTDPAVRGTESVNGTELHRIGSSGVTRPDLLATWEYVDRISAYELEALVTEAGLVRSYRVRYVAIDDGDRYRVERSARWSAVGNVTVTEPDWYERARARTGE